MILDLDRLRMEYAKIYQVEEGSARREPLGASLSLSEPSGLINASFLCLTPSLSPSHLPVAPLARIAVIKNSEVFFDRNLVHGCCASSSGK